MELLFSYSFLNILWVAPVMLIAYFLLTYSLMTGLKFLGSRRKRTNRSLHAEAIILQMESTGQLVNDKPEVKLQVQVQPDRGRNFITELTATVPNHNHFYCGSKVWVKYTGNQVSLLSNQD